jgi:ADP-ribose pyrophosphatase
VALEEKVEEKNMQEKWQTAARQTVLDHAYVTVYMDEVILPDGRRIPDWPIIHTKDYVNLMVINQAGEVMVLEGYKHGIGRSSWQVVGGYLEPGEEPVAAAQRELLEETGYQSDDWTFLGSFIIDANRRTGQGTFFLAQNARLIAPPDHDDLEAFSVRWVTVDEVRAALSDGRVQGLSYATNLALGLCRINFSAVSP